MQILLVAATAMEIAPFLEQRPAADFLITGVGCPQAIYQLTKRLHQIDYDLVIQAGIAGSFKSSINLADVVVVTEDNFADVGIYEKNNFYTIFETDLADKNLFPFTNGWLKNNTELVNQLSLKKVRAVTVNTVTDNEEQIRMVVSKFDPEIETMEGAALHYICMQENIPFLQLRGISNYVGERDKTKWKIRDAIGNLNEELMKLVEKLTG